MDRHERLNTSADDLFGNAMPNISYEHSTYKTGYRYYGRNMASTYEGDAEAATNPDVFYNVPTEQQELYLLDISYGRPVFGGWLNIKGQAADTRLKLESGTKKAWMLGADWTYRF